MLSLTLKTDKPEAELGLYEEDKQIAYIAWEAHRQLAETLLIKIDELVKQNHKTLQDLTGIAAFQGPGSFTGLRIGLTVANALAYGLSVPVVAAEGDDWITLCLAKLGSGVNEQPTIPEYGAPAHITKQRK